MVALLVCLIPTTIGALLSAIGIAGMDRLVQRNVLAMSGRAVEAAGDVNTLLLDKTGTITLGNRQAAAFVPLTGVTPDALADAAQLSSLADETPGGSLHRRVRQAGIRPSGAHARANSRTPIGSNSAHDHKDVRCRPQRRIPQVAQGRRELASPNGCAPKAAACQPNSATSSTASPPPAARPWSSARSSTATPTVLGVIHLKDVVKQGMRERFDEMRRMGIRTVMITGDNPLTAKAIADEAGCRRLPRRGHPRGQDGADQEGAGRRQARRDDR